MIEKVNPCHPDKVADRIAGAIVDLAYSDSAEYKMWGNGVALPNVVFVLSGIVYYSQFPT